MAYRVLGVTPHKNKPDKWRQVSLLDGDKVITAFCGGTQPDQLKPGEDLPGGWTVQDGQYGPVLRYPQPQGGGRGGGFAASWRNSEEGFRYEQARMDRRTALMQAVQIGGSPDGVEGLADRLYAWLRKE